MENTNYNIVLAGSNRSMAPQTSDGQNYQIILYDSSKRDGGQLIIHEPPAYRSVYVAGARVDTKTGHLIQILSDGTEIDAGYVRGGVGEKGVPGDPGVTFTPIVSTDGVLSWSNSGGLQNPASVNIRGPQGPTGRGFKILGYYATKSALDTAKKATASEGDAYGVGTSTPYDIYIFDGVSREFKNNGPLQGAKGDDGITFTPAVSADGVLSWTNNGGLENPASVGLKGAKGDTPVRGVDYFTAEDIAEMIATIRSGSVASKQALGLVQIGNNLSISNSGVLSVPSGSTSTAGVLRLVDNYNNSDTDKAASAYALNQLYRLFNNAGTGAAVLYDPQELTTAQQVQACKNIAAVSANDGVVVGSLSSDVADKAYCDGIVSVVSVTLPASGWTNQAQTIVNSAFVTTGYQYIVQATSASYDAYCAAKIRASDVTSANRMTFTCSTVPAATLYVTVLKIRVS